MYVYETSRTIKSHNLKISRWRSLAARSVHFRQSYPVGVSFDRNVFVSRSFLVSCKQKWQKKKKKRKLYKIYYIHTVAFVLVISFQNLIAFCEMKVTIKSKYLRET